MRALVLLGAVLVLTSVPAQGQQSSNRELAATFTYFDLAPNDSLAAKQAGALSVRLNELVGLQRVYYAQHGRFAVSTEDLPEFEPFKGAIIHIDSGKDWFSLQAHLPNVAVYSITAWRQGTQTRSGTFSDMSLAGNPEVPRQ